MFHTNQQRIDRYILHLAPLALNNSTMRVRPCFVANDNGVAPSLHFALTLAPFLSSTDAARMWPRSNSNTL